MFSDMNSAVSLPPLPASSLYLIQDSSLNISSSHDIWGGGGDEEIVQSRVNRAAGAWVVVRTPVKIHVHPPKLLVTEVDFLSPSASNGPGVLGRSPHHRHMGFLCVTKSSAPTGII